MYFFLQKKRDFSSLLRGDIRLLEGGKEGIILEMGR